MGYAQVKHSNSPLPEYSVYIYHHPENQHEGQNDWEMRTMTPDLNAAMDEAESLYQSQSFRKVEVKQRIIDPKTDNVCDYTLKVFSDDQTLFKGVIWAGVLSVLSVASGISALIAFVF